MVCKRCGAILREGDLFCGKCGAPVEQIPRESYYDDNLYRSKSEKHRYRDSFLEKKEERSHALLMTVTILLVIAVLAAAFVILFFFSRRNRSSSGADGTVTVVSDGNQNQGGAGAAGQDGEIVIWTEEDQSAAAGEEAGAEGQSAEAGERAVGEGQSAEAGERAAGEGQSAEAGERAAGEGQSAETEERAQGENQTVQTGEEADGTGQPVTEAEIVAVDSARMDQIWKEDSTAKTWGVFVYDLNHWKEYGTDGAGEPMYASALISVPILYTAAALLDQGQLTLNDTITYVNSIGGRGELEPEQREGQSYPLSYYLTAMTTYSDNNCMNCLIDYLGLERINSVCRSAGFSSVDLQRKIVAEITDGKDNYVSAKDLAGMLKELYLGKYKTLGSAFIRQYFRIDEGDGYRTVIGLADQLPSSILFLNHNGRGDTRYNEVALISDDTHQYILSIMCNGDYGFQYETAVENISNYVYQSLT